MSSTPHTSAPKGKRVHVRLRDGEVIEGKFVERTGKFVVLDQCRIRARDIDQFYIIKQPCLPTTSDSTTGLETPSDGSMTGEN